MAASKPGEELMREKIAKAQQQTAKPAGNDVQQQIAEAAYYRAQSRGFQPGSEEQDWLAAEAEILARARGDGGAGLR
jgi:hypothetical protein